MKSHKLFTLFLVLVAAMMLVACGGTAATEEAPADAPAEAPAEEPTEEAADEPAEEGGSLSLAGSTSVQPLAEVLALAYMDANPGVVIDVQGGGSSAGVTAAGDGTADIGDASRAVKDSEFETYPDLVPNVICLEGIAVVTNPSVDLGNLTMDELYGIFSGEITDFSEVGGPDMAITVVAREEGSGTRDAFDSKVLEPNEGVLVDSAILQSSNGAVRTTVAETEGTIAYLAMGYIDESTNLVNVDGVEISVDTVQDGSYPISRPFNMITNGEATGLAADFLAFVMGEEGQAIIEKEGYVLP